MLVNTLLAKVIGTQNERDLKKLRPIIAEVHKRFDVSVAEVGQQSLYRRAELGIGLVGADRAHVVQVLDTAENYIAYRPGVDLLSTRRKVLSSED